MKESQWQKIGKMKVNEWGRDVKLGHLAPHRLRIAIWNLLLWKVQSLSNWLDFRTRIIIVIV